MSEGPRRMEMRIAELTPKRPANQHTSAFLGAQKSTQPMAKNGMSDARSMAANPDIVEEVIAESTDQDPPTKAKVLRAIKQHKTEQEQPMPATATIDDQAQISAFSFRIQPVVAAAGQYHAAIVTD